MAKYQWTDDDPVYVGLGAVRLTSGGVYPPVSEAIERIPPKIGDAVYVILVVFMALDMLISWTAIIRQTLRHNHIPPYTPIGRFYDEHFTDDYLEHYFPNMRRPEEEE